MPTPALPPHQPKPGDNAYQMPPVHLYEPCSDGCPGWGIYDTNRFDSNGGFRELQRCDACSRFASDNDALHFALTQGDHDELRGSIEGGDFWTSSLADFADRNPHLAIIAIELTPGASTSIPTHTSAVEVTRKPAAGWPHDDWTQLEAVTLGPWAQRPGSEAANVLDAANDVLGWITISTSSQGDRVTTSATYVRVNQSPAVPFASHTATVQFATAGLATEHYDHLKTAALTAWGLWAEETTISTTY